MGEVGNNEAIPEKYKNRPEIGAWPATRLAEYKVYMLVRVSTSLCEGSKATERSCQFS